MAGQFISDNNNNDNDKIIAAQFLQRHTIPNMFRTCIAAIAVMVEYLSHYQFVFHVCPLFRSDITGPGNFMKSSACRTIASRRITLLGQFIF